MTVKAILLKKLFPQETVFFGRDGNEVNGLPEGVIPQGNILGQFTAPSQPDRIFYLVEVDTVLFLLRIAKAASYADYDCFAVVHASSLDTEPKEIKQRFYLWNKHLSDAPNLKEISHDS